MPIKIPSGLPARDIRDSERIFALEKPEAERQRVRPLKLVILIGMFLLCQYSG